MTNLDIIDAEVVPSVEEHRASVARVRDNLGRTAEDIVWQIKNRSWAALGYRDWDDMREAEYGDLIIKLPRGDRPELVAKLRREGLTQRSIADTLGVSRPTVTADLNVRTDNEAPPEITNSRGQSRPASYIRREADPRDEPARVDRATGEVFDNAPHEPSRWVTPGQFTDDEDVVRPMIAELEGRGVITTGELPFQTSEDDEEGHL